MSRTPLARPIAELIDQLLAADTISARQELAKEVGETWDREVSVGIADAVNRIAREDLPRAERLAEVACNLAEHSADPFCHARIRRAAGNLQVLRGNYADAIQIFQACIAQFASISEEIEVAATLSSSLQPLIYLGRYSEALERSQQAREIAEGRHDNLLLARLDLNVGNIFHRQDRFTEALTYYKRSQVALDDLGQKRDCTIAWLNLAVVHIALNDFVRGEEAYQNARTLALSENMTSIVAQADYNVAYLYFRRGQYMEAMQLYQQARQYSERVGDRYHAALCDLDRAEMYLDLHLNREGMELAEQAVSAFESLDMGYETAKALVWLGVGAYQNRQPFLALDRFAKAQDRMRTQENAIWVALLNFYQAIVFHQEGRFNEGLRSGMAAHDFFSSFPHSGKAVQIRLLLARLHLALGQMREAENYATSALQTAEQLRSPFLLTQGLAIRGEIDLRRDAFDAASHSYIEALQWLEKSPSRRQGEESKLSLSKNRLDLYEALVSLMISSPSSGHPPEAVLELVEKAKSRELAELLAFRANTVPAPSKNRSGLVEEVRALRNELNWFYEQIDTAETRTGDDSAQQALDTRSRIQELEQVLMGTLGELRFADEQFFILQSGGTVPLNEIKGLIRPDEIIVEFYEAYGVLYACLLGNEAVRIVRTARTERIHDLLRSLRSHFAKFDRGNNRRALSKASVLAGVKTILFGLQRELIQPIRKHIEGHRLIIVPHGMLHYLPFHSLFDGSRYLFEDHVISYATSASQYYLSSTKQPDLEERDVFLGGLDERARLANLLPDARKFLAGTGNVENLEQYGSGARFVHLDTRMRLREDNPLFSTFTIGTEEISILDAYNLRLPCSLVGLSGTGPGIEPARNGDEIHVLAQGLEYAGALTLLMPLWNITGEPLVEFLENFYKKASCEPDKPLAFQQTIWAIQDRYPHPYHWASFVLHGRTGRT